MGGAPVDNETALVLGQLAERKEQGQVAVIKGATGPQEAPPRRRPFEVDGAEWQSQGALGAGHVVDDAASGAREVLEGAQEDAFFLGRSPLFFDPAPEAPVPSLPESTDGHGHSLAHRLPGAALATVTAEDGDLYQGASGPGRQWATVAAWLDPTTPVRGDRGRAPRRA